MVRGRRVWRRGCSRIIRRLRMSLCISTGAIQSNNGFPITLPGYSRSSRHLRALLTPSEVFALIRQIGLHCRLKTHPHIVFFSTGLPGFPVSETTQVDFAMSLLGSASRYPFMPDTNLSADTVGTCFSNTTAMSCRNSAGWSAVTQCPRDALPTRFTIVSTITCRRGDPVGVDAQM